MNYDKLFMELLSRIQNVEEKIGALEAKQKATNERITALESLVSSFSPQAEPVSPSMAVSKTYRFLGDYFACLNEDIVTLTYRDIEAILRADLPASAKSGNIRAWWANTDSHSQATAWLAYGYKVINLDMSNQCVTFEKRPYVKGRKKTEKEYKK